MYARTYIQGSAVNPDPVTHDHGRNICGFIFWNILSKENEKVSVLYITNWFTVCDWIRSIYNTVHTQKRCIKYETDLLWIHLIWNIYLKNIIWDIASCES